MSAVLHEAWFCPYCIPCSSRVAVCAADYPLVIYQETESFDDFIRTLGSLEISNSNMHREHRILNVWNFSMEFWQENAVSKINHFIHNTNIYYFFMSIHLFDCDVTNLFGKIQQKRDWLRIQRIFFINHSFVKEKKYKKDIFEDSACSKSNIDSSKKLSSIK